MWIFDSNADTIMDLGFRSSFLTYLLLILPIFVTLGPGGCFGAKDFQAFRLQQFELHGSSYGSSGSNLNYETRLLPGSPILSSPRRCYLVRLVDLTVEMYRELVRYNVAGIIIIVPRPEQVRILSPGTIEQFLAVENEMLSSASVPMGSESGATQSAVPVYFIYESEDVQEIYETVKSSAETGGPNSRSALQTLLQNIHGNGVQFVTGSTIGTPKAKTDAQVTSIQGSLFGTNSEKVFPILISANYDSMGAAPELAFGADSNGSGATGLLELARLFSHLYSHSPPGSTSGAASGTSGTGSHTHVKPQNSLLFLLSGAGYFNFQGTQKYLEDQTENIEGSELLDTKLAICLDSLTGVPGQLVVQLARGIKEGTMISTFVNNLRRIAETQYPTSLHIEISQRRLRTDGLLNWEHEKFILKKINSLTLTSYKEAEDRRSSLLDVPGKENLTDLAIKIHVIAEAVAASLFNVSGIESSGQTHRAFSGSLSVSESSLSSIFEYIVSEPRSAQLLASKSNRFVTSLRSLLGRYTHETQTFVMKPDKRDANLVFYDTTGGIVSAYNVKPAIFDLVLSLGIAIYLGIFYLGIMNFHHAFNFFSEKKSSKESNNSNGTSNSSTNGQSHRKVQ